MVFLPGDRPGSRPLARFLHLGVAPSWADLIAFLLLAATAVLIVRGAGEMSEPLAQLRTTPVTLDPARLPEYALLTTLRMFAALGASLLFTFTVATLAAKNRKAGLLIVQASHAEPWATDATPARLAEELKLMADWLGLSSVRVEKKGDLADTLGEAVG